MLPVCGALFEQRLLTAPHRCIDVEHLLHNESETGIEDGVRIREDELVAIGAEVQHSHPPQRCNVQSEGARSIFGKKAAQCLCLLLGRHVRQVAHLERDHDLMQDFLDRSLQSLPTESGAQNRVLFRNPGPGIGEAVRVDRLIEPYFKLLDVHAPGSSLEVMKQHALLKRRERVTVLDHGTPEGHRERSLGSESLADLDPSVTVIIIGKIIL